MHFTDPFPISNFYFYLVRFFDTENDGAIRIFNQLKKKKIGNRAGLPVVPACLPTISGVETILSQEGMRLIFCHLLRFLLEHYLFYKLTII